ncbi:thiol-activated cytolysin family protein [Hymenobacter antarcticus]|uniref:Thiol-activated cytolysin n=1 Tax=Hymenobacter antarcticus TaxID=486270 RepID=A0ABP7QLF9_9BACT
MKTASYNFLTLLGLLICIVLDTEGKPKPRYRVPRTKVQQALVKDEKKLLSQKTINTPTEKCEIKEMEWSPGKAETILLDPQSDIIYPGCVLDAASLQDGRYTEIIGARKPIKLSTSLAITKIGAAPVNNPKNSSVRQGIRSIINSAINGRNPAQTTISCVEIFSKEHLGLVLQGKYSAGFGNVEAAYNFDREDVKSRYLLDVTQVYYTIDVDAIGPYGFFDYKPHGPVDYSPVYISSVKYGRRIMVIMETDRSIQGQAASIKAEFSSFAASGSFSANSLVEKLFDEKSVNILAMGGNPNAPFEILRAVARKASLHDILINGAIWGPNDQGVPLAYTLKHCTDGSIFTLVQSGKYTSRTCTMKQTEEYSLELSDIVKLCATPDGGEDREFDGEGPDLDFRLDIFNEGNNVYANISCNWTQSENGNTHCSVYKNRVLIGKVPDNYAVLDIKSTKVASYKGKLKGHGSHAIERNIMSEPTGPVRILSIIGDTPDDDDPWVGDCGSEHTQIQKISFFPIIVSVRNKDV